MIKTYLRTRLKKIQKYILHILDRELQELLSDDEIKFVKDFFVPYTNHFNEKFLNTLPSFLRDLGLNKKINKESDDKS